MLWYIPYSRRALVRYIRPTPRADSPLAPPPSPGQVHDELLFEVPTAEVEATLPVVRRVMETAAAPTHVLSVPLIVDAGSGPSWGDAH